MKVNTVSYSCVLLVATLSFGTEAMPSEGVASRQTRQAPAPGNSLQEFPVKIAGGQNANTPTVGALISVPIYNPYNVGNRDDSPAPPIVFGPRPRPQRPQFSPQFFRPQNYYYPPYYNN
ncbi:hypothetical protein SK128_000789, partial [Halocaridina rubra]